jgi:DNA-binding transcriptional ArsR family regulator
MEQRPGTPRLLRELNDRAALELLLAGGPMTRAQVGERTGLSKVTASQLLSRLEERGLVSTVGEQAGGRGPNAALYAVVPSSAYVVGLHVEHDEVSAGVADITGEVVTQVSVDPNGAANPVELVRGAVATACRSAGVEMSRLNALVICTPGVLDPSTGDPRLAVNLPAWHEGVLEALRSVLRQPVTIENDVNLAAMAERAVGIAQGADDFVLMWIGVGLGLATIIGGGCTAAWRARRARSATRGPRAAAAGRQPSGHRRLPVPWWAPRRRGPLAESCGPRAHGRGGRAGRGRRSRGR